MPVKFEVKASKSYFHYLFAFLLLSSISSFIESSAYAAPLKTNYCKDKTKDSDKDNITDCDEVKKTKTNPKKKDSNKNKIPDGDEDKNGNGIANEDEDDNVKKFAKLKSNLDDDGDCLQNEDEDDWGLSSKNADSDGDGLIDGFEDFDNDGILNKDEDDRPSEGKSDEDILCGDPPVPTPAPTATPTRAPINPTPAPTPTQSTLPTEGANFDFLGNVTERGKQIFEIPSYLSANQLRGRTASISYSCDGCHVERGGYSFTMLSTGTSQPPMNTFGITEQELADLAAWLNRGRTE